MNDTPNEERQQLLAIIDAHRRFGAKPRRRPKVRRAWKPAFAWRSK